jgi:predicted nucleic acid-binding protein
VSGGRRFLLDTNIVSETRKLQMNERVRAFLTEADASSLYLSVLSVGELRKGVANKQKSDPNGATLLNGWVDGLEQSFATRMIAIDTSVARCWGELSSGRSRPVIDTLIAATALVHDMILVTRNTKDLQGIDIPLLDPWAEP